MSLQILTAVDRAELEPERAFALNRDGARMLAGVAARRGIPIIHLSTDYVLDGRAALAYVETDPTAPTTVYGRSKLEGEEAVRAANPKHIILQTAWVYSPSGAISLPPLCSGHARTPHYGSSPTNTGAQPMPHI